MYKIHTSQLDALFSRIAQSQALYLPIEAAGIVNFSSWHEGAAVRLDALKTAKSPKDAFFPQSETLYTCRGTGSDLSVTPEALQDAPFTLFGVKACDISGIAVLDKVFLSDPCDSFYAARREHGTVVALACAYPEETCFCAAFGIDCASPEADVVTWLSGEELFWLSRTPKGDALTQAVAGLLEDTDASAVEAEQARIRAVVSRLPYSDLSLEGWGGEDTEEKFSSPLWEGLSAACLGCGTCTFVCPTCQCYDIKDYTAGGEVHRYRCWDSCMYSDFTMMAHGNNRTTQMQRFRQRFMHKLMYFPQNNRGVFSCVGCGRCVEKCPAALNIVKVIKAFNTEGGERK